MSEASGILDIIDEAESRRHRGSKDRAEAIPVQAMLLFRLGEFQLAVVADAVANVIAGEHPTKIPRTPSYILGLVPYGEGSLTVLDLSAFLNLGVSDAGANLELSERRILIVGVNQLEAGLLCDKALGVINVEESELQETIILKGGRLPEFLEYEFDDSAGRVGLLNIAKLLDTARIKT